MNNVLITTTLFCIGLNAFQLASANEEDFRPVYFREGDFSLEMPAVPQLSAQPLGKDNEVHMLQVKDYQKTGYMATYLDLPVEPAGADRIEKIKAFRDAMRKDLELV